MESDPDFVIIEFETILHLSARAHIGGVYPVGRDAIADCGAGSLFGSRSAS